jgi:hypothetical protein
MNEIDLIINVLKIGAQSAIKGIGKDIVIKPYEKLKKSVSNLLKRENKDSSDLIHRYKDNPKKWESKLRKSLNSINQKIDPSIIQQAKHLQQIITNTKKDGPSINIGGDAHGIIQGNGNKITISFDKK